MTEAIEFRLERYFDRLWPICRSLAGSGFRESLDILGEVIPTTRLRFPTGMSVFDWTVPKEWVPRDAYFVDPRGVKHAQFKEHNLHLLGYSAPFAGRMPLSELKQHLFSLPEQPAAIPYLTSYYRERWGFCLSHDELQSLPNGEYDVVVDTALVEGHIEVGEAVLPGHTDDEILFTTYLCHPSLANNELSGPLVLAFLYEQLAARADRRYTYRFAVMPETIGAICYLHERGDYLRRHLTAGYVLTCIGDAGPITYRSSRRGNTVADRAASLVLRGHGAHEILPFDAFEGSDEKQFCSPGFDLPVGSVMRTRNYRYPEYHTSLDNKALISFPAMRVVIDVLLRITSALEANTMWANTVKFGEPQLGKRGLYSSLGGDHDLQQSTRALLWVLNLADGTRDLLAIAEQSGLALDLVSAAAAELARTGLLERHETHRALSPHVVNLGTP